MSEKISSVRSVQEIKFNEQQPNNKIFICFLIVFMSLFILKSKHCA